MQDSGTARAMKHPEVMRLSTSTFGLRLQQLFCDGRLPFLRRRLQHSTLLLLLRQSLAQAVIDDSSKSSLPVLSAQRPP